MKHTFFASLFSSGFCILIFAIVFALSWFLVPRMILHGWYIVLAAIFMVSFALTITCIIRIIKERVVQARTYGTSLIGLIAAALGLSALQVCGISMPLCGATIGLGIISSLFPGFLFHILAQWSVLIVMLSILAQWISLFIMHCFRRIPSSRQSESQ